MKKVIHDMVINKKKRVRWWYDRSKKTWCYALYNNALGKLSETKYVKTRDEVLTEVIKLANNENT